MRSIALQVVLFQVLGVAVAAAEAPPVRCERLTFSVALMPGAPANQTLVGYLCARGAIQHKTIQVLIHGGTYDHLYWDFPFEPETYSYVEAVTAAGYATLALDRIGSGESSHPAPGIALNLRVGAFTVHQVVQALRAGLLLVPAFGFVRAERVMLVGHSLGSFIAVAEAGTFGDVDGVLLSSFAHVSGPSTILARQLVYPAAFDPKFAGSGLPLDYLTTLPGRRDDLFYFTPMADPEVIAVDEELKQTVTVGELIDGPNVTPLAINIHVPTFISIGDFDFFGCFPPSCTAYDFLGKELTPANYSADACVEGAIIPEMGHDQNLHVNAQDWFDVALEWADRRVGASTKTPPPQPCPSSEVRSRS